MKTLKDIKQDMSDLYDALKAGHVDLKTAGELANISGKFLKAEQLEFAKEVFRGRQVRAAILINPDA